MPAARTAALVLFPGALGDFICFLPTLAGLYARHAGRLRLVAQSSLLTLLRMPGVEMVPIHRREIADLFANASPPAGNTVALLGGFGAVYSWSGAGNPQVAQRLALINAGPVAVHRFRGMHAGEHAIDYYARCAGVAPAADVSSMLAFDDQPLAAWQRERGLDRPRLLAVHPGSGAARKNWLGFDEVVRVWRARQAGVVVVLSGPAEQEAIRRVGSAHAGVSEGSGRRWAQATRRQPRVVHASDLSLAQVAALLRCAALYLGNDSGISHLAGAVGTRGVVLFGPTDPRMWAPRGGRLRVLHAPDACGLCGPEVFCTHRLRPAAVVAALEA